MIKIEKGVPIPKSKRGRDAKYPWRQLEPGDSFEVKLKDSGLEKIKGLQARLSSLGVTTFGKGNCITRVNEAGDGVRVWRVA